MQFCLTIKLLRVCEGRIVQLHVSLTPLDMVSVTVSFGLWDGTEND